MENEVMTNNEVIEVAEEITPVNYSKKGLIIAGAAAALVVGAIIYKKIIKPAIAKKKAEKENSEMIEVDYKESDVEEDYES